MTYIYYIDNEKFTTDNYFDIPRYHVSSPDENTPALQDLNSEHKVWCEKGRILHRLTGPARIYSDRSYSFWLNDKNYFNNIHDWLKDHPKQDNAFQVEMLLKYI
jgi:hypothetical protein